MTAKIFGAMVAALALAGCTGDVGDPTDDSAVLQGEDETGQISSELSAGVPIGSTLATTANLNLRTGAGTSYSVRLVIPSGAHVTTVNRTSPSGGWYNIKYNGVVGWSYGSYLRLISSPSPTPTPTPAPVATARDNAVTRAKGGVGFSYWWGHGRWVPFGATSSTKGVCTGSCPNCTHSGVNGADCSGYVGKIWQVPSTNADPTHDGHPYSTINFVGSNSQWRTVDRGAVHRADALVYNTNGAGHIFLYESGDGWGSMWAYEAKGCAIGIVHDLRTASSAYKAIARAGY